MGENNRRRVDDEQRRAFLRVLGIAGAATAGTQVTDGFSLSDLQDAVTADGAGELASMGEAIRADLSGTPDADLLGTAIAETVDGIERLPELRRRGTTESLESAYRELAEPARRAETHLTDVGFFASAEANLPPFSSEHITATTRQLVGTGSLATLLADAGFSRSERTAVAVNVVDNDDHLSHWAPARVYREHGVDDVAFEDVPPLQQRAVGGALNWIEGLDRHVWQNRVLLTDELIADALWDVKVMLGGAVLVAHAARGIANGDISDEQLTALVTGGSAVAIAGQTDLVSDAVWITDEMRAPRGGA